MSEVLKEIRCNKCDYCGKEITEEQENGFSILITREKDNDGDYLIAEYSSYLFNNDMGDMCKECSDKILKKIMKAIKDLGFPERYEKADVNKLKELLKE